MSSTSRRSFTSDERAIAEELADKDDQDMSVEEAVALATKMHAKQEKDNMVIRKLGRFINSQLTKYFGAFRQRGYIFDHTSYGLSAWDWLLCVLGTYSAVMTPVLLVFTNSQWKGHFAVDKCLDVVFLLDIFIRLSTAFREGGYVVNNRWTIFVSYLSGWLVCDVSSALPPLVAPGDSFLSQAIKLLRGLRYFRLGRKLDKLAGANILRISQMILSFVLLGHWLGLGWFALAIEPLKASSEDGTLDAEPPYPWIWTNEDATGNEYICSLYWALSVMTNLKGLPVHESRQCFWEDPFSLEPAKERIYTICAFLMGAIFFSVIYGNINQAVTNFYSSGLRYRKRMAEIDEFVRFHKLSKDVRKKVRNFVDFAFSVTKGLNIDTISSQLPAHLQLEIYMQMNKKMVEQAR